MLKDFGVSSDFQGHLLTVGICYVSRALLAIGLLFVAFWCSNKLKIFVAAAMRRALIEETLVKFVSNAAKWIVLCFSGVSILGIVGIETASFAAIIAASGLAIGFAFQGSLSNMASGLMLLLFRPFRVGHMISVSGNTGIVGELGLFSTSLDTLDNRRVIIPNSNVFGQTIENISHHPLRRVDVSVGVSYSADIDLTRSALEKVPKAVALVVSQPPAEIVMVCLGASSVDWQVRAYANTGDFFLVHEALLVQCKRQLDLANINIPFPQLTVHVNK